ncbi:glycoside hydrolase family 43 protein [Microbacterium sp. 179-I 3D2 NHS]|uniref:glycoside hydrolase family 43 protein n=1 Tax=Microbacterium sp. 179-I 3D2 NHS TaxID=3235178 RepID=UPI00399FDC3A
MTEDSAPATPAWRDYFADPFVLRTDDGVYVAIGTEDPSPAGGRVFPMLVSTDLIAWHDRGRALERPDAALGDAYWAPEVAHAEDRWWLYYSVGHDIHGHHVRVASSDEPFGPFADSGSVLTPHERFAIDAHPFLDVDGTRYLFFARDVLDHDRPGTHLAVARLDGMQRLAGTTVPVLAPWADWQIYERDRRMYGARWDWHTLEGPSVVRRHGRYWMTFSAGAWTGPGYAVTWAVADHPLGPWERAPDAAAALLASDGILLGPGHNSLTTAPDGGDVIVFHSWNDERTHRLMHLRRIDFTPDGPRLGGALGDA